MMFFHSDNVKMETLRTPGRPNTVNFSQAINTAWVFPGQGSQVAGMGSDLWYRSYARMRLRQAEAILGWSVSQAFRQEDLLNLTQYCQPCLFVFSSILADLLIQQGCQPAFVTGYSLGEYIALYVAGVFDFESGLRLIKQRAELMANAPPGIMVALTGCDINVLAEKVITTPDVEIISDESTLTIVSGSASAVESVIAQVTASRKIHLKVSNPFHTKLMRQTELAFQQVLDTVPFQTARIPVLSNSGPTPTVEASKLKQRLRSHMTGKIRWQATVERLALEGVEQVFEIGASRGLSNRLQKAQSSFSLQSVTSLADLSSAIDSSLAAP
jgi:[acyl-carrier-protein] S-malonyltransferase